MVYTDGIHLIAESIDELHAFAKSAGLNRCWFDGMARHPHYDIYSVPGDRRSAMLDKILSLGALKVTTRELIKVSRLCYFIPVTEEEVKRWEEKYAWELKRPVTPKEQKMLDDIYKRVTDKIFKDQ